MATLGIGLIVKNEADNLRECLDTVKWADEIVVLDSGSTDDTLAIAREYTDRVFISEDWQGFGIQRQRLQSYMTSDWILMLDADERVTAELAESIRRIVKEDRQDTAYDIPRLSWVFGRFIRHCGWYPDYVMRLYPAKAACYNDSLVHEKLVLKDKINTKRISGDLLHYTYVDLEHYLVKSAGYAAAWAAQRQARGKRSSILQGILHGLACFVKMYVYRLGFLDGRQGFLLSLLSAHSTFVKYADLWIRANDEQSPHRIK